MNNRDSFDICIVGAGVVGLAIAHRVAEIFASRNFSIVLLDQESSFGQHISSRNSEVIHAGIYYPPDSLKARFCAPGKEKLYSYCEHNEIPHKKIGKLIVAMHDEIPALEALAENALLNGVDDLQLLSKEEVHRRECEVKADAALFSPSTGIIDSHSYMQSLLHKAQRLGVQFAPRTRVENIEQKHSGFIVSCLIDEKNDSEEYQFDCTMLINSAGLGAQELARRTEGVSISVIPALHYCKGDYFDYQGGSPFQHLIYPMPPKNTVGLGIHATMDLSSQLKFGPDTEYVSQQNYQIDASKAEYFARSIQSYFPRICAADLKPAYAGIRPKLAGPNEPAADYQIQDSSVHGVEGLIQLFGMESPALTSSLAIADAIAEKVGQSI